MQKLLGHYAPQFNGYSQEDAQEFLITLLRGLHEEFNEIVAKPYVRMEVEEAGKSEEVLVYIDRCFMHVFKTKGNS